MADSIIGNTVFTLKRFVVERYGKEAWERLVDNVPESERRGVSGVILSSGECPRASYQALLAAVEAVLGREALIASAEYQLRQQFSRFYRFMIKLVSVETALSKTSAMWAKTWSVGRLTLHERRPGHVCFRLAEFPINEAHRIHLGHYIKNFVETVAKESYRSETRCIDEQTTEYIYDRALADW